MGKCVEGHVTEGLKCQLCGAPLDFASSMEDVLKVKLSLPSPPKSQAILVGVGGNVRAEHVSYLGIGEEKVSYSSLTLPLVKGGLADDYERSYKETLRRYLDGLQFFSSPARLAVLDSTNLLSPAVGSLLIDVPAIVVIPTPDSSTLELSTSYLTLNVLDRSQIPALLVRRDVIEDSTGYVHGVGVVNGMELLSSLASLVLSSYEEIWDFMQLNSKLGVRTYALTWVLGGSDLVFGSPLNAMRASTFVRSVQFLEEEVESLALAGRVDKNQVESVERSFRELVRDGFKGKLSTTKVMLTSTESSVYDLLLMYGVKGVVGLEVLEAAHNKLQSRAEAR
ncbi:hypothetical protein HS1genome_1524 [Sulfodiicoccus acidiphilus]|uniref:Uncharacterized protein n=1 Tax=Sulfodiicoccus acidiphilus TaxID=1670455 RepID=A0A348B4N3_9CREN|nr:hypothetical protein [Sulfodiicoccus acidiphilus]BBD73135.1 hypothetical protein HS1genome_1524 [Sulfodiicoccus acidiphilus]GGU00566.1 hypothetical protein GCM10007116_17250 [Sulfodiicoccus acidiphilus]